MDWDPDEAFEEGFEAAENMLADGFDRVIEEDELDKDIFPDADDIGLAGSFAHMMQDEKDLHDFPDDIDEQNWRQAMEMCTASGEPRQGGQPFEVYVRQCIDTPGFFKRRRK